MHCNTNANLCLMHTFSIYNSMYCIQFSKTFQLYKLFYNFFVWKSHPTKVYNKLVWICHPICRNFFYFFFTKVLYVLSHTSTCKLTCNRNFNKSFQVLQHPDFPIWMECSINKELRRFKGEWDQKTDKVTNPWKTWKSKLYPPRGNNKK